MKSVLRIVFLIFVSSLLAVLVLSTVELLLSVYDAHAEDFIKYGVGIGPSADYGSGETKAFSIGHEDSILPIGPFIYQVELGGYFDSASGVGRSGSAFGNGSLGVECTPGYFYLQGLLGAGLISTPDTLLGGMFQFNEDFVIGVRDNHGTGIGIDYKHISSADIESPNIGRDFVMLRLSTSW
jgi:hypothetical protein